MDERTWDLKGEFLKILHETVKLSFPRRAIHGEKDQKVTPLMGEAVKNILENYGN